jgi:hypothetical protein
MTRFAPAVLLLVFAMLATSVASAQSVPYCPPGQAPVFVHGFAALKSHLGATMGEPITCEYGDPAGTPDTQQETTAGLAYYRASTNTPTFTNGWQHWALTERGLEFWEGQAVDPPASATLQVLAGGQSNANASGPPVLASVDLPGRIVGTYNVRSWPVESADTLMRQAGHNTAVWVTDSMRGDDGETWYRIGAGEYVHSDGVRLPTPPQQTYSGRWMDADLNEPAMLVAYEGGQAVYAALAVKGRITSRTPTGTFTITRRVQNETMDSSTIGIPRDSEGGYFLEDVLFTQYFTGGGAAIHYNYWESNWGYPGSQGCLGLNYEDALWFWEFASIGTTLVVRR